MLRTLYTLYIIVLVSCHLAVAGYIRKKHRYNNKNPSTIPLCVRGTMEKTCGILLQLNFKLEISCV